MSLEWITNLIVKYNNMEKNGFTPERNYWLNGKSWFVSSQKLYCNKKEASLEEIDEFKKIMEEF